MGGPVEANMPYLVGDQLGLNTAELFIPETNGMIVNNQDLNRMIQNIINGDAENLTNGSSSTIIKELREEYSAIIESKTQALRTMIALKEAIRLFNRGRNRQARNDIINSV